MVTLKHIDTVQNRVVFNLDPGSETVASVQDIGSLIKQELKLAPLADDSDIFTWTGLEQLSGGNVVGIVMVLRPGWTIWTEDSGGGRHRFRITEGIILGDSGADPLGSPADVVWSLAEYTVSSILGAATVDDIATLVTDMASLKTDMEKVRRYLGIGVKKTISGNTLTVTEEDKTTTALTFTLDDGDAPKIQEDTT